MVARLFFHADGSGFETDKFYCTPVLFLPLRNWEVRKHQPYDVTMLHVAKVMIQSAGSHRCLLTIIVWFWQNDNSDSGRCRIICWGISWLVCLKATRGGMSHNATWLILVLVFNSCICIEAQLKCGSLELVEFRCTRAVVCVEFPEVITRLRVIPRDKINPKWSRIWSVGTRSFTVTTFSFKQHSVMSFKL